MKYCFIVLLLLCGMKAWVQGEPYYYKIDLVEGRAPVISILKKDRTYYQINGKNADASAVSFKAKEGALLVKNSTSKNLSFRLMAPVGDGDAVISQVVPLNADVEMELPFSETGTFNKGDLLLTGKESTSIDKVRVDILDSGKTITNVSLKALLAAAEHTPAPSHNSTAWGGSCNECPGYENYDEGFIYYDFTCKCFYTIKKKGDQSIKIKLNLAKMTMLPRQEVQFKVVNVNRYIYDVGIETSDVQYESEVPILLRQLFIGDSATLLGNLLRAFSTLPTGPQSLREEKGLAAKYERFLNALKDFSDKYAVLQAEKLKAYRSCFNFPCCGENRIGFSLEDIFKALAEVRIALLELQLEAASEEATKKLQAELESDRKVLKLMGELAAETDDNKKKVIQAQIDAENKKKLTKTELEQGVPEKETMLRLFTNIKNLQASLPDEQALSNLFLFVDNIRKQHAEFMTPPIYVSGNRMEFIFKFKPKDSSMVAKYNLMPLYRDSAYYDIPVILKSFVSFSSGSFFVPHRWLDNKTYTWQRIPNEYNNVGDSVMYGLTESGYTSRPLGFAAFANLQWKIHRSIGLGPSIGVGLTIEGKPRMTYLTGISVFLGDLKQLGITFGYAGMQVNQLAANWLEVADKGIKYKTNPNLDYYKEFKVGGFVAVTYTPFNVSRRPLSRAGRRD